MIKHLLTRCVAFLFFLVLASLASLAEEAPEAATDRKEWNFKVYLGDKQIGFHKYQLSDYGDQYRLRSEADFEVKFLFVTAYRYHHFNTEYWNGDCLNRIESWTDANGKKFSVTGYQDDDSLNVTTLDSNEAVAAGCVKTFAYWDKSFLDSPVLLNAQTGELQKVEVESLPPEAVSIGGAERVADRYRLIANEVDLELWYGDNDEWLGLVSTVKNGRKIRYEIS